MYSFDVFDTLITRRTATPFGIFALMQVRLNTDEQYKDLSVYIKNNFYYLRVNAVELARANYQSNGIEDVTLEQIYEAIALTGCLSNQEKKILLSLELAIECANAVGIEKNISMVKKLLQAGEKVILISDMYLDAKTIRNMLVFVDVIFKTIPLYVSSEYKVAKYTGQLYKVVQKKENLNLNQWHHFGDNSYSDVAVPKSLGIKAEQFMYESLMPIEKEMLSKKEQDAYFQLTIGTSRNIRLRQNCVDAEAIGCTVGGVILYPYVQWILQESINKGITRLYFIARDGFILKKIADILIKRLELPIQTIYIYGSRKAWRMPSYSGRSGEFKNIIAWSYPQCITSIRKLADALLVSLNDLFEFLPAWSKNKENLSYTELVAIIIELEDNAHFIKFFSHLQQKKRQLVIGYLKQELDVSDDAFAFVDLAGGGLTQSCLATLMQDFYDKPIHTFFFKMDKINLMKNCIYYTFLPTKLHSNLIVEMICRAAHGQTEGYYVNENKFVPILKDKEGAAIIAHGYKEYVAGIEKFANDYQRIVHQNRMLGVNLELLLSYTAYCVHRPDKSLLDFFADMPNSVTGREDHIVSFAPKLSKNDIRNIYLFRTTEPIEYYYSGTDLEYSILRCTDMQKKKIAFYQANKNKIIERFNRLVKKKLPIRIQKHDLEDFPYAVLGRHIVLYGAGKFGKKMYTALLHSPDNEVVLWVDKNYQALGETAMPISNINNIEAVSYDKIVIAVMSKDIALSIKNMLMEKGIENKKIVCLWQYMEYLMGYLNV